MRKRPLLLFLCSLAFLYFPAELIGRWYLGIPLFVGDLFFSILLPVVLLVGLIRVTKLGWYTLIAFGALWGGKDIYEIYLSQGETLSTALIHLFIYGLSLIYFINPRVRLVYFDPTQRWWRVKRRFETHSPAMLRHGETWDYPIVLNVSEGGCFVKTPHLLPMNEKLNVWIPLPEPLKVSTIQATGEVRWVASETVRKGMGISFLDLKGPHRKALKQFIRKQL